MDSSSSSSIFFNQENASTLKMYLCALLYLLPGFTGGAAISYSAAALPFYTDSSNNSTIQMTESEASWFVSLGAPMQMLGNFLSGFVMERFGRKRTIIFSCVLVLVSSAILSFATKYEVLLVGCFLCGTAVGLVRPAISLVISEITLIRLRGSMGSLMTLTPNGGYLYGIMFSSIVPVHILPWILVLPSIIFLVFSWYVVESPIWLMTKGRTTEAREVIAWLRGPQYHLEPEAKELENLACEQLGDQPVSRDPILSRAFLFPLFILSSLFFFHALVGGDDISFYALTVFDYPGVAISPTLMAMLFQTSFTVGCLLAPIIMRKLNRRPQFIAGSIILGSLSAIIGFYYQFHFYNISSVLAYSPVFLHLAFGFAYGTLFGPIPVTLSSEMFPQHFRSLGCGISNSTRYVSQFIQLKTYVMLKESLGMSGVYYIHCVVAVTAAAFAFFLLPETRNKTYTELEEMFKKSSPPDLENVKSQNPKLEFQI